MDTGSGNPWIPASAGMTTKRWLPGLPRSVCIRGRNDGQKGARPGLSWQVISRGANESPLHGFTP